MPDALIDLADAIAAELRAASFARPITVARLWNPSPELPENPKPNDMCHVTVVGRTDDESAETRIHTRHRFKIDIGVQRRLRDRTNDEIDPLVALTREIRRWLLNRTLPDINARPIEVETATLCSPSHLEQLGQYTAVFTLTYLLITKDGL